MKIEYKFRQQKDAPFSFLFFMVFTFTIGVSCTLYRLFELTLPSVLDENIEVRALLNLYLLR